MNMFNPSASSSSFPKQGSPRTGTSDIFGEAPFGTTQGTFGTTSSGQQQSFFAPSTSTSAFQTQPTGAFQQFQATNVPPQGHGIPQGIIMKSRAKKEKKEKKEKERYYDQKSAMRRLDEGKYSYVSNIGHMYSAQHSTFSSLKRWWEKEASLGNNSANPQFRGTGRSAQRGYDDILLDLINIRSRQGVLLQLPLMLSGKPDSILNYLKLYKTQYEGDIVSISQYIFDNTDIKGDDGLLRFIIQNSFNIYSIYTFAALYNKSTLFALPDNFNIDKYDRFRELILSVYKSADVGVVFTNISNNIQTELYNTLYRLYGVRTGMTRVEKSTKAVKTLNVDEIRLFIAASRKLKNKTDYKYMYYDSSNNEITESHEKKKTKGEKAQFKYYDKFQEYLRTVADHKEEGKYPVININSTKDRFTIATLGNQVTKLTDKHIFELSKDFGSGNIVRLKFAAFTPDDVVKTLTKSRVDVSDSDVSSLNRQLQGLVSQSGTTFSSSFQTAAPFSTVSPGGAQTSADITQERVAGGTVLGNVQPGANVDL